MESHPVVHPAGPLDDKAQTQADLNALRHRVRGGYGLWHANSPVALLEQLRRGDPQRLERLLVHAGSLPPWLARYVPFVLLAAARAALDAGRAEEALARIQSSLASFRRGGQNDDLFGLVMAATVAAVAQAQLGRGEEMVAALREADGAAHALGQFGEPWSSASLALLAVGQSQALVAQGQVSEAMRALDPLPPCEAPSIARDCRRQQAVALVIAGHHGQAAPRLAELLEQDRGAQDRVGEAICMQYLAEVARFLGDYAEVRRFGDLLLTLLPQLGHFRAEARVCQTLAEAATAQGRVSESLRLGEAARQLFAQAGDRVAEGQALVAVSLNWMLRGDLERAASGFSRVHTLASELGHRELEHDAVQGLGRVELAAGRHQAAARHLLRAEKVARLAGLRAAHPLTLYHLGTALAQHAASLPAAELQTLSELPADASPRTAALAVWVAAADLAKQSGLSGLHRTIDIARARLLDEGGQSAEACSILLQVCESFVQDRSTGAILDSHRDEARSAVAEARHQAEIERERSAVLAAEIERRQSLEAELVSARQAAEAGSRAKTEFLATVSHEIRTPLNAILGFAEILQCEEHGEFDTEAVATIARNGKILLDLFDDLLHYSQLEHGTLTVRSEPVAVVSAVQQAVQTQIPAARTRRLALDLRISQPDDSGRLGGYDPDSATVMVDPLRLQQILGNLLGNAIKFTDSGSVAIAVHFDIDCTPPMVQIAVRDSGPGIAQGDFERIFEPFTQLDASATRRYTGAGLGLAVVRRLAIQLGGTISVQSEVNKGSCFSLSLPLANVRLYAARSPTPADLPVHRPAQAWPMAVLLVDADAVTRSAGQLLLSKLGYSVHTADSSQAALTAVLTKPVDVVFLSLHLQGLHPVDVASALRANCKHRLHLVGTTSMPQDFSGPEVMDRFDQLAPMPLVPDHIMSVLKTAWLALHRET